MVCSPRSSGLNMMKKPSMIAGCGAPVMQESTTRMLGSPWMKKRSSEMKRYPRMSFSSWPSSETERKLTLSMMGLSVSIRKS